MPPRSAVNAPPKKSTRGNPETILQGRIMAALGVLPGCIVWRNSVGTAVYESGARVEYGVGGKGAPDLLCEVTHGGCSIAVWLEVKTPDGAIEPHQRVWHSAARRTGRCVAVVRSVADALAVVAEVQTLGRVVGVWEVVALAAVARALEGASE
jgi:hypothetical protein